MPYLQCHAQHKLRGGPQSIFDFEGAKAVVPVRHPYDVIESHWQRRQTEQHVARVPEKYASLLQHQKRFDTFEFYVTLETLDERLDQMERLVDHLGLDQMPEAWRKTAIYWENIWHHEYKHDPYPGDKSIVDFAVKHYGFDT